MNVTSGPHVETRLQAYLDGEVEPREAAAIEAHAARCASCRHALEELREVRALLADIEAPVLSRSVWPELSGRLTTAKPWWSPALAWATAGAAVAGIVIGLMIGVPPPASRTADQDLWSAVGASFAVDRGVTVAEFPADPTGEGS